MCQMFSMCQMHRLCFVVLIGGLGFMQTAYALADIIDVANSGFEEDSVADGNFSGSAISGWNKLGPAGIFNPDASYFVDEAPAGQNVAVLGAAGSILSQDLMGQSLAYGIYTFSFDVGNRLDELLPDLGFSFLVNAVTIIPLTSSTQPAIPEGEFRTWSFTFDVTNENVFDSFLGDPLRIRFLSLDTSTGGSVAIDNVRGFFRSIPEPNIAWWLAIAVGIVWGRHRSRF